MKKLLLVLTVTLGAIAVDAQQVIKLYEQVVPAPSGEEQVIREGNRISVISGVTDPSITVYMPAKEKATGTAVILCPGGALRFHAWGTDVVDMAEWLNERGITAIGLKYRLRIAEPQRPTVTSDTPTAMPLDLKITEFDRVVNANVNPDNSPSSLVVIERSISDALKAIRIVRQHAAEWNLDPDKVGFLGFSAGGGVAIGATVRADKESMPSFLATAYGPSMIDVEVPDGAPKLFIATRADHRNVAAGLVALFMEWKNAGGNAEMYIYDDGRMGFGPDDTGTTSGTWRESFYRWLTSNGF